MKKISIFIKINFFLLVFFAFVVMQTACESESDCQNQDTIEGIIDTVYDLGICFQYMHDTSYVIDDIIQFKQLKNKIDSLFLADDNGCDTAELIVPNFEAQTLLAFFSEIKGCDAAYNRAVVKDEIQHKYIYSIEIVSCGNCNYLIPSMNWVLVPKLPEDYTVEYKILKQ